MLCRVSIGMKGTPYAILGCETPRRMPVEISGRLADNFRQGKRDNWIATIAQLSGISASHDFSRTMLLVNLGNLLRKVTVCAQTLRVRHPISVVHLSVRSVAVADLRCCLHDDQQLVERHQSLWLGEVRAHGVATSGDDNELAV